MKIAIIGSGISGLTCAWYLAREHQVTLYEANDYAGGHTATKQITLNGQNISVDTGFIVYNERTYPNFIQLLNELGIEGQPTEMSFSVTHPDIDLEYNGNSLNRLFAQRKNLFNPRFYYFLYEIIRFNSLCKKLLKQQDNDRNLTLMDFLQRHSFSDYFSQNYILPMTAAIWSASLAEVKRLPFSFFLRFFDNHGLFNIINRPQWYVIKGGSGEYVKQILHKLSDSLTLYLSTPVTKVVRHSEGVTITSHLGEQHHDTVIFCCHSDQTLAMLADASSDEVNILQAQPYQENAVILHTDITLLPKQKRAWASWNYLLSSSPDREHIPASVTYNMNILQQFALKETLCVSLNPLLTIEPTKVIAKFTYSHPVFSQTSQLAQQQRNMINGKNHTWFCGAYWYNGFHEDGVNSALDVISQLRKTDE